MYLTVVLVLVLAVALVSAGADTYDCIRWGYFQQHVKPFKQPTQAPQVFQSIIDLTPKMASRQNICYQFLCAKAQPIHNIKFSFAIKLRVIQIVRWKITTCQWHQQERHPPACLRY